MPNAADRRAVKKSSQRERLAKEQALDDLVSVVQTKEGRRVVWRQLEAAGVFRQSFIQGEPESTAFNEGRRSIGLALLADLHAIDPSYYLTMAKEAAAEAKITADPDPDPKPDTEETD